MKLKILYIIAALILIAGITASIIIMQKPNSQTVEILQDEQLLYQINLSETKDQTIKIECNGGYNLIEIKEGKIRVKESDCNDNTCVKMQWLDSGAPIVCLPHRLVIRFAENGDADAVAR